MDTQLTKAIALLDEARNLLDQAATQGAGATSVPSRSQGSPPTHAPAPEQLPVTEEAQQLIGLLERAGVFPHQATELAEFAVEHLPPERRVKLKGALRTLRSDERSAESAVDALRRLYKQQWGHDVPSRPKEEA